MNEKTVLCGWVSTLSLMQQTVILTALRGPDGLIKYHPCKPIVRAMRRSILKDAFTGIEFDSFTGGGGGSFCGNVFKDYPEYENCTYKLSDIIKDYYESSDTLPMHFHMHMLHAAEILGYKHPNSSFKEFWYEFYITGVKYMHLNIETEEELDSRLGDSEAGWRSASVYDN